MQENSFVEYLRELADLYERHPKLPPIYELGEQYGSTIIFAPDLETLQVCVKALGPGDKSSDESAIWYLPKKHPHIRVCAFHANVCVKVTTGTKVIPAEPEKVIPAQPERVEEVFEWVCPSLMKPPDIPELPAPALQLTAVGSYADDELPF